MGYNMATAVSAATSGPSVKMMVRKRVGNKSSIKITMTKTFAKEVFDIECAGQFLTVMYGDGPQSGTFSISLKSEETEGDIEVRNCGKHSYSLMVDAWRGLTNAAMKTSPCEIVAQSENSCIFQVPKSAT